MATPDFLAQDDSNFTTIRYYTAQDPYYYSIDNRPLTDIEQNLKDIRSGGSDAARRAAVIGALATGAIGGHLFTTNSNLKGFTGLGVVSISSTVVRVSPGSVYDTRTVSASVTDVVVKQALLTKNQDFTINAPLSVGTSMVYTIEGEFVELSNANMAASTLPCLDDENDYLPSTLMVGELKLSLISGIAAATGTEVPAATTAGKFPLYNITIANGASTYSVSLHTNAPYYKGIRRSVTPVPLTSGGATNVEVNEMPAVSFVDGSTKGAMIPFSLGDDNLNPYNPIKLRITFTPTITGGNATFRLRYKGFSNGELTSVSATTSGNDVVAVNAVAGGVQTFTTVLASVPNTEFSGFVSNRWTVNKEHLNIILERVGGAGTDTNTGDICVLSVALVQ